MNFNETLRERRESLNLTQEQAAEKFHLALREYQDIENDRVKPSMMEKCGILSGLGMTFDVAIELASQGSFHSFGEGLDKTAAFTDDPFVKEDQGFFTFVNRKTDHLETSISKATIRSGNDILRYVLDFSDKPWITTEHLRQFIVKAARLLKLEIYGAQNQSSPRILPT